MPFRERRASTFQRFDWAVGRLGAAEAVPTGEVMIVDAIGLFHPEASDALDLTVWCDVDLDTATRRGIQRDTSLGRAHLSLWHDVWVPNERYFVERFEPRARADVLFADAWPGSLD